MKISMISLAMIAGLSLSAHAADVSKIFTGTMTEMEADGSEAMTMADQLTVNTHTDASGNFTIPFELVEVVGSHTINSEMRNPVALADGTGYTFELWGAADGGTLENLGPVIFHGTAGAFNDVVFAHSHLIGDTTLFQTGTGSITVQKDGSEVLVRNEDIVDSSETVQFKVTSTLTYTP